MPDMTDFQSELMDMITKDESPSQISDRIKDMLYAKSAEKVDAYKPVAANAVFGDQEVETETETEVEAEVDTEAQADVEDEDYLEQPES